MELHVLNALGEIHVLLIVLAGVVLHGLAVELHQFVDGFNVEAAGVDFELIVKDLVGKIFRKFFLAGVDGVRRALALGVGRRRRAFKFLRCPRPALQEVIDFLLLGFENL